MESDFTKDNRFRFGFILMCFIKKRSLYSSERKIFLFKTLTTGRNLFSYEKSNL